VKNKLSAISEKTKSLIAVNQGGIDELLAEGAKRHAEGTEGRAERC
jgi:N12 class adenine-specific DNA methylase